MMEVTLLLSTLFSQQLHPFEMENKGQLYFFLKGNKGQNKGRSKYLYYNVCLPAVKKFSEIIIFVLLNLFMYNYSKNIYFNVTKNSLA